MKNVGLLAASLPLLLVGGISQAEQASSAKQLTLGVGSVSMSAEEQGGSLISLSNGVSSDYKVSTEVFLSSIESEFDDNKTEQSSTTIQAHGLIPITKLSGATNASGVGVIVTSERGETKFEESKTKTGDRNIGVYGTVGIKMFDAALSVNNIEDTSKVEDADETKYSYNTISLSGSFNMSKTTRVSAIYTPSSYDFYDDSVNENAVGGETASMVLAGTHKLAGPKMVLTGGLQRNIPQKIEKDIEGATFESTNEGGTTLSFGAQMNFGDFQPRAGLSTFTSQDDTAQLLGIGTDYMINTIAITGDVAFMNGDFKSGDTDAKITGFNFSAGVSTMF